MRNAILRCNVWYDVEAARNFILQRGRRRDVVLFKRSFSILASSFLKP